MVENLTELIKRGRFKIYNVDDITEEAILQFEDYGYFITEKGNISYHNITSGFHDDFVSSSYFSVSDVEAKDPEQIYNFYSQDNIKLISNINTKKTSLVKNSLF